MKQQSHKNNNWFILLFVLIENISKSTNYFMIFFDCQKKLTLKKNEFCI